MVIKIDCYLSLGCPSEEALRKNIRDALEEENTRADVNISRIDDIKASLLGIKGSPSVYINGKELQPQDIQGFS
ncbi:MAG TPA: hypothetical protein PK864_02240 [Syntrophorhabdaceae bacterium]|nr:hypothetical protein [Syntrophorhabdaceae bacterium]HON84830.1 hypothetical protein [Syntrophorhabdaceae bacterium]HOT41909.1 hypothetical protein [Syntrophorhabdaceae bacterium]HPC66408.1 hypothetical protein [Syntrophorhabdaceae bacterium]HQE79845.1 hypothetical protein [Syntrophorhabdaceae bacterium]